MYEQGSGCYTMARGVGLYFAVLARANCMRVMVLGALASHVMPSDLMD